MKSPMLAKFSIHQAQQAPAPVAAHGVLGLDADHWAEGRNPATSRPMVEKLRNWELATSPFSSKMGWKPRESSDVGICRDVPSGFYILK